MPNSLAKDLRNLLARVTLEARDTAEQAARSALENLAVHEKDYRPHMSTEQRQLRNRLRERGRALGDVRDERTGKQDIRHLTEDVAYEHWHRLLFTRFLAENGLLHTDASQGNLPITLPECDELAPQLGARDGFELACRFASEILPGVFRPNDPVFELTLAVDDHVKLRKLLDAFPKEVFAADDSLGWTYQFWQAKQKNEVNASGKKIGPDELSAVTQLFTEDYMVEFLLHNTLGAWWAGKLGPIVATTEKEARSKAALAVTDGLGVTWAYLRLIQNDQTKSWSPAVGTFSEWPTQAKLIRLVDPCMGSGHFLVFALPMLARLRMEEERLSAAQAIRATLQDNLFGLELDERCAQIAAFNVALTAWKVGGYQVLPSLHLACCGLSPYTSEREWTSFAGDDDRLQRGMKRLYGLFREAPVLGSLINPLAMGGDLVQADFHEIQPLLERALAREARNEVSHEMVVAASGLAKAAELLTGQFTLVATNVPYLTEKRQATTLKRHIQTFFPDSKADLATAFISRCAELGLCGTVAVVSPMLWLFLGSYRDLRDRLLTSTQFETIVRLGPNAFDTAYSEAVNVSMAVLNIAAPSSDAAFVSLDVSMPMSPSAKSHALQCDPLTFVNQTRMRKNPDSRITTDTDSGESRVEKYAICMRGIVSGDQDKWTRKFWELPVLSKRWRALQSTPPGTRMGLINEHRSNLPVFTGRETIIDWLEEGREMLRPGITNAAYGRPGVAVGQMGSLPVTLYSGELYDNSTAPIVPHTANLLPALWAYCTDRSFFDEVRRIDSKQNVTNATFTKIPFDIVRWQRVAAERYPHGLPRPFSSDPTQWLFNGSPKGSDQPLHVAVARLLAYQWPRQTGSGFTDCPALGPDGLEGLADQDGIVCLPSINREQPAAHRLRALLVKALGRCDERALLASAGPKGSKSTTLEEWLRDEFFEQHCELFHHRPFIWHIWDGRKDGFHALVNYHTLDHATLQKLTYSYLGDWIRHQEGDAKCDKPGADERLGVAQALQAELAAILEGAAPYDLFIRWKSLSKQPLGWHPDVSDGVRLNIRPFVTADILRKRVKIRWEKDRGKDPVRDKAEYPWFWCDAEPDTDPEPGRDFTGHRWNNVHLTLACKRLAARKAG